jgi:uracil phosphoribosyltransferase
VTSARTPVTSAPVSSTEHRWSGVTLIDHPLVQVKLTQLRDAGAGTQVFRERLTQVATLMVAEVTRDLTTRSCTVQTPMAEHTGTALVRPLVIAPILRAGLGMMEGMLNLLPDAGVAHIGMYRNEKTLRPETYYFKSPPHLAEADVLVVDPMLATGWSGTAALSLLKERGARSLRFVCLLSCPQGLDQLRGAHPDVPIFTAAIDPELNDKGYIVPGLGDAGDRFFGTVG